MEDGETLGYLLRYCFNNYFPSEGWVTISQFRPEIEKNPENHVNPV